MRMKLPFIFTFPPFPLFIAAWPENKGKSSNFKSALEGTSDHAASEEHRMTARQQGEFPGLCHSDPLHCFYSFSCLFSYVLEMQTSAVDTNLNYGRTSIFGGTTTQPGPFTWFRHLKGNCTPQAC